MYGVVLSPPVSARFSLVAAGFAAPPFTSGSLAAVSCAGAASEASAPVLASLSPWPWCSTVDFSELASMSFSEGAEAVGAGAVPPPLSLPKTTSEQV